MVEQASGVDYIVETRDPFDDQIASLEEKSKEAWAEARHAHQLGVDLAGPAKAAEREAARIDAEITDLCEIADRVEESYHYFDRVGFEIALDACCMWANWHDLSDTSIEGSDFGHEEADVRLPLEVQVSYSKVALTGRFDQFQVCSFFEVEGDVELGEGIVGPVSHFLLGVRDFAVRPRAMFLIAEW